MLEMLLQGNTARNSASSFDVADSSKPTVHDSDIIRATSEVVEDETDFLDRKPMPQHNGLWAGQKEV